MNTLTMKTENVNVLFFVSQSHGDADYLGLGLEGGRLKLVWSLGWFSRGEIETAFKYNDVQWHTVLIYRFVCPTQSTALNYKRLNKFYLKKVHTGISHRYAVHNCSNINAMLSVTVSVVSTIWGIRVGVKVYGAREQLGRHMQ